VGSRATLVVDTGLGRRNGEAVLREVAKVSRNTELYIVTTHFHVEHTVGYVAFPPTAAYVNSTIQEAEFAVRISCARGHRRRHSGRVHARGLQTIPPQLPLAKRGRS